MKGFILAAGLGTRLRPLTNLLPKPMVPLLNRPLIGWAVESFLAAGVRDLIVNLHHLPEPLEDYLRTEYAGRAEFFFSHEHPQILGTGGGIRRIRPQLANEEEFFVVNGDTVQFPRWDALRDARRAHDAVAALTLRHPPEGDKFTAVYLDDGLVTGFNSGRGEPLMFSGSHVLSTRIFDYLPDREFSGIVEHAYQPLLDTARERIAGVVDDGLWFDVGTPQRYLGASRALLEATIRGELAIVPGSEIRGDSLFHTTARGSASHSTVGARCVVEGNVNESILFDVVTNARGATLDRCIVSHGVTVGPGAYSHEVLV
ncbi:MAG: sugar phosphate nucleotidyltransferase [Thermoanaerobaculia bacterium]